MGDIGDLKLLIRGLCGAKDTFLQNSVIFTFSMLIFTIISITRKAKSINYNLEILPNSFCPEMR
jgi:hypothetical protein